MKTPIFRVEKLTCYAGGKVDHEEFTVLKVGRESFCASREELEELQKQIAMALSDRKEAEHEEE